MAGLIHSLESLLVFSLRHSAVWSGGLVLGLSYACLSMLCLCAVLYSGSGWARDSIPVNRCRHSPYPLRLMACVIGTEP
jgi:hypothetical protein